VLVVEDNAVVAQAVAAGLRDQGIAVDVAGDGGAGLDKAGLSPYDVIVLDRDLPRVHGDAVCASLVAGPAQARILMLTAAAAVDDRVDGLNLGADDYLTKPFSVVQLQGRIKTVLRLKDAQDRSELLNRHLLAVNAELDQNLNARDSDLVHARNALVLALARLVA